MSISKILKEDNILEFNTSFKKLLESKLDEKLNSDELRELKIYYNDFLIQLNKVKKSIDLDSDSQVKALNNLKKESSKYFGQLVYDYIVGTVEKITFTIVKNELENDQQRESIEPVPALENMLHKLRDFFNKKLNESFDEDDFEKELEDYTRGQLDARFEDNNSKLYNMNKSKPEYKVIQAKDEIFHKFYAKNKDKFKFPYVENDRGDKVKLREFTLTEAFDVEDIAEFFAIGEHKKEVQAFLVGRKNIQDVYDELVDRDFDKDIIDDFKAQYM